MKKLGTKKLETNRLILRKVILNDLDNLFDNWASDIITTKYLTFKTHESKDETLKFLNYWLNKYESAGFEWVIELKDNHQVIGVISGDTSYKYNCVELGYSISSKYFKQGIMTEALDKIINYLLNECDCNVVEAIIPSQNIGSIKVASKVGMALEATLKDRYKDKDNNIQDLLIYSIFRK